MKNLIENRSRSSLNRGMRIEIEVEPIRGDNLGVDHRPWLKVIRLIGLFVPDEESSIVTSLHNNETDLRQWIVSVQL